MPWLYIFLSTICSLFLAFGLKIVEQRKLDRIRVLTVNYIVAAAASVIQSISLKEPLVLSEVPIEIWGMGLFLGAVFLIVFVMLSRSVDVNGVGISVTAMRISLLLPVSAGILLFGEELHGLKIVGIILVFISLILLVNRQEKVGFKIDKHSFLLIGVFVLAGTADVILKFFETYYTDQVSESWFTALLYATAFVIGTAMLVVKKNLQFTREEVSFGIVIGVVNLYSTIFLLYALGHMPASIVFPVINIMVVVGGTVVGILKWKDKLTQVQWAGLALACVSLILLL